MVASFTTILLEIRKNEGTALFLVLSEVSALLAKRCNEYASFNRNDQ